MVGQGNTCVLLERRWPMRTVWFLLASAVSRSPTLLKGNGYLLRSRRFLCFGTQLCRAPAGGGVVTLLDVPRVTVPSPNPTRRAALVTRPGLPQFRGGGLFFLPGWAAGVAQGHARKFPASRRAPLPPHLSLTDPLRRRKLLLVRERQRAARRKGGQRASFLAKMVVRVRLGIIITLLSHRRSWGRNSFIL